MITAITATIGATTGANITDTTDITGVIIAGTIVITGVTITATTIIVVTTGPDSRVISLKFDI